MIIRRGIVTDVFELSRLWREMVREEDKTLDPDLDMWRWYMTNLMATKTYFMFVAEEENQIVGFIDYIMVPEPGRRCWKGVGNAFYVIPAFRNKEVAKLLWNEQEKSAKENGAKELAANCFQDNLNYWMNHGFKSEGFLLRKVI